LHLLVKAGILRGEVPQLAGCLNLGAKKASKGVWLVRHPLEHTIVGTIVRECAVQRAEALTPIIVPVDANDHCVPKDSVDMVLSCCCIHFDRNVLGCSLVTDDEVAILVEHEQSRERVVVLLLQVVAEVPPIELRVGEVKLGIGC
jgi:hypothetical protein